MNRSLRRLLAPLVPARIFADTTNQLFNPFLGTIATGIGISTQQLGLLVSLRSLAGLSGPLFGSVADRRGHLFMARIGIVLLASGLLLLAMSSSLLTAAVAMLPMGLALGMFNPILQAYVSSHVEYGRRARALGILEYSWALAGIAGLSGLGWLMTAFGWRTAVLTLAALLLVSLAGLRAKPAAAGGGELPVSTPLLPAAIPRSVWAATAAVGLTFFGFFNIMIIHGVWLAERYAFTPALLGWTALVLGFADLAGVTIVSSAADRFGPRRLALVASLLCAAVYVLPALGSGLPVVAVALILMRLLMQVTFVSILPLLSELQPEARARILALAGAVGQIGMATAAASGPWLYGRTGPAGLGISSAASALATFLLLLFCIRERKEIT